MLCAVIKKMCELAVTVRRKTCSATNLTPADCYVSHLHRLGLGNLGKGLRFLEFDGPMSEMS